MSSKPASGCLFTLLLLIFSLAVRQFDLSSHFRHIFGTFRLTDDFVVYYIILSLLQKLQARVDGNITVVMAVVMYDVHHVSSFQTCKFKVGGMK
jgi:hypothetical protein